MYIVRNGNSWTMGTSRVERVVALDNGKFILKSFKNKATDSEMLPAGTQSDEFFLATENGALTGSTGGWKLVDAKKTRLEQGEGKLDITLRNESLQVTKTYILYPESSIIREWLTLKNVGTTTLKITDPGFLSFATKVGSASSLDFLWMTGGRNIPGSWNLQKEKLSKDKARVFDSFDPFPGSDLKYGQRPGSESYAPWFSLYGNDTNNGLFVGWDYFGHWASSVSLDDNADAVTTQLKIAGYNKSLEPGESVSTPKAFIGLYNNDLDNAGNECLDWQYRYMWDYTRDRWFPGIRMLGNWSAGTQWGKNWSGGDGDFQSCFLKVFRLADLIRSVGADVYHRDWGWWDKAGDWNGPDWRATGDYLNKSGIGQLLYAFVYHAEPGSEIATKHPDWLIKDTMVTNLNMLCDLSQPDVVDGLGKVLDRFAANWGAYEWRNDSVFTCQKDGDDTVLLAQDQGMRELTKGFLDRNPECAFQAVNFGGTYAGYDYVRYASCISFSDGGVGALRNYYGSLLFPPDKTSDIPDVWQPDSYDKAIWRGLLCMNFDMTGDTTDPAKLEGVREIIDIYHYLQKNGVVGRWVKVYRPQVTGDDPTMYLQRLSGDQKRGIVIPKHTAQAAVTIKPKGLIPDEVYFVSLHESQATEKRTGADLMANGIKIEKMLPGELIYLNLPMHPGSKLDTKAPTSPGKVKKALGENMGYPGVEIAWKAGVDNNWISYYEIFRDGIYLDKVAKGTFYFDHSAGADLAANYEVRSVDGTGNVSSKATAKGAKADRSMIYDDAHDSVILTGSWQRQTNLLLAHADTVSLSNQKGDTAELVFSGKKILWFAKLGEDCGKAEVSVDGGTPEVIDTYSADNIWGACVYQKDLTTAGSHTLKIKVLGEHGANSKGDSICIDGFRAEP
ncbi:MAG: hypothetical protein ABFD54_06795 [Armatimonadota bacterium]|nr:hypothetical protein [bacterium]